MDMFAEFDRVCGEHRSKDKATLKAPFNWAGGKSKSIKQLMDHIPYTSRYIEPFGGSGALLMARKPTKLEVFNDAYSGITDFYRCIRSEKLINELIGRLDLTVHSRESWVIAKETWQKIDDPVERAARWYEMLMYSFSSLGRNWGRSTGINAGIAGRVRDRIQHFPDIHARLRKVQIENQDFEEILIDYDHKDSVFYLDPDYVDSNRGIYKHQMSEDDHLRMLSRIKSMDGFVAVSSYRNKLYDAQKFWTDIIEWDVNMSIKSMSYSGNNNKSDLKGLETRGSATEALYIKESN